MRGSAGLWIRSSDLRVSMIRAATDQPGSRTSHGARRMSDSRNVPHTTDAGFKRCVLPMIFRASESTPPIQSERGTLRWQCSVPTGLNFSPERNGLRAEIEVQHTRVVSLSFISASKADLWANPQELGCNAILTNSATAYFINGVRHDTS